MGQDFRDEEWHRADFVLRGEYCTPSEVHAHLERTREALGASLLIHVAFDHEFIMRSLCWAVGKPVEVGNNLSEWIRSADYQNKNRKFNNRFVSDADRLKYDARHQFKPIAAGMIARSLLEIKYNIDSRESPVLSRQARSFLGSSWTGFGLNHTGKTGVPPWDGEVRSILLLKDAAAEVSHKGGLALLDLGVRLKCTAEANARRDSVVMQQVMRELTYAPGDPDSTLEDVSAKALELACNITGSTGGAVYYLSTSQRQLRCAASREESGHSFPSVLPFDLESTVGWSVDRHRAYQQIGSSRKALTRAVEADGGTELITPIAGPLANTSSPAVGAIALFHQEGDPRGYKSYERALVRNIALRLALFRTNIATQKIATAISTLRASSPRRMQPTPLELPSAVPDQPRDITIATERFEEPLGWLAESTDSHSVTLRIALPDRDTLSPHGMSLHRVAAYPLERMRDDYAIEREGDPGLHWAVFESAREKYVPDARMDRRHFRAEIREGTRSVLCVPVKVDGILSGTLNLESPTVDNYLPYMPLMVALSGAIGRTLADARAEIEGDLLDRAAQVLAKRHDFGGPLGKIRTEVAGMEPPETRQSVEAKIESLMSVVEELRSAGIPARRIYSRTLWEIIEECRWHNQLRIQHEKPTDHIFHERLNGRADVCVATILDSVFGNVNFHSSADGYDSAGRRVPRMGFTTCRLQGATQAVLRIENMSREFLDQRFCAELYRYPVKGSHGEIRLGTYIATINARRIGGRIHAAVLKDGQTVRTTIILPVGDLRADQ